MDSNARISLPESIEHYAPKFDGSGSKIFSISRNHLYHSIIDGGLVEDY